MSGSLSDGIVFHEKGDTSKGHPLYPGFDPSEIVLHKGTTVLPGSLALPCDILKEQDVSVKLRDGTTIYVDVLRPPTIAFKVPAIISWGPFGKNEGVNRKMVADMPWRCGIPQHTVSGLENFEALDPAYWCNHGYALVHPDIRGAWGSEGDSRVNSDQEGRDGYDLIEWVAKQEWCNGCVTMAGNSWLTQSQWFIGAERPPHLTCLCPYEGWNDLYNDNSNRGGIPDPEFQQFLLNKSYAGLGKTEDLTKHVLENTLWDQYYENRKAKIEKIDVPMYIVASWTNFLHSRGTFRGYMESFGCNEKWLRVHNSHEWPDLYKPENVEDCRKFLDHYMKGVSNGWESTPPVRLSILNFGHTDIINRPEQEFPLARQQSVKLFLDSNTNSLTWNERISISSTKTISTRKDTAKFSYAFKNRTELTGFFALNLFVSSPQNAEDIDLFVNLVKHSSSGKKLQTICIDPGYLEEDPESERRECREMYERGDKSVDLFFADGPHGRLRVSHRRLDQKLSTPHWPRYTHDKEELLEPKQIAEVAIELWPCGMIFEAGEQLVVEVAGFHLRPEGLPFISPCPTLNKDGHEIAIHTGGEHQSYLLVPHIPNSV